MTHHPVTHCSLTETARQPTEMLQITVAYALPDKQYLLDVTLAKGATVEQAIIASGLLQLRQDIDLQVNKTGIFSRPAQLTDSVREGDRIEIYRPLIADPKALRRQRAAQNNATEKPSVHRPGTETTRQTTPSIPDQHNRVSP